MHEFKENTSSASLVSIHVGGSLMSRLSRKQDNSCNPQSFGITMSMVNRKRCPGSMVSNLRVKYMKCMVGVSNKGGKTTYKRSQDFKIGGLEG